MLIELQLAIQEVGIGLMSDRLEESIDRDLCAMLIRFALIHYQLCSLYSRLSEESLSLMLPEYLDILRLQDSILHHLTGTQLVSTNDKVDLLRQAREIDRVATGCVSTADDGNGLAFVEKPVAGSAGTHAGTHILLLLRQPEHLGRGAGGDDHRLGGDGVLTIYGSDEGALTEVYLGDQSGADICTVPLSLLTQVVHHLETSHSLRITGEVLYRRGLRQLSARLQSLYDDGGAIGARSIDGNSVSRRTGADDQDVCLSILVRIHNDLILSL